MARFDIISRDGNSVRYSGKPRYNGSYLKPSFLEFSEISVPSPIAWEVGDYVDYPRTGMRYRLYSIPQPSKNARKGSHGGAFTYSNVQFHTATKELEIALFRDLVANDNGIHFSTSPDVATFENVEGIARRIQACMDDFYPGRWVIRIADFDAVADAEIIEKISEAKDFALSGGTCLDALSKIYELWQDIGWIHSYEDGVEVITIGYANKRIDANTSDAFLYGKGNGLTAIKRNQTNKDEFATRLYVYGSERNLISRYYNSLAIANAESVDIRNLMLPLDVWGVTDGLPDARKAYLENAEAVARYGVIPKTHYFDSTDAGADIYPSIERMTIGQIREVLADMGQMQYFPDEGIYLDDSERVDEVLSAINPTDAGVLNADGKRYEDTIEAYIKDDVTIAIPAQSTAEVKAFYSTRILANVTFAREGKGTVSIAPNMNCVFIGESIGSIRAQFVMQSADGLYTQTKEVTATAVNDTNWTLPIPSMQIDYDKKDYAEFQVFITMQAWVTPVEGEERSVLLKLPTNTLAVHFNTLFPKYFTIDLKQIGFDIETQASKGEGKVISMKSGMCAGRNFVITSCQYQSDTDSWRLTCARQKDDTLGLLFPYKDYPIASGDRFVLLDIAMPETYIRVAMERLLAEGKKLLAKASKIQSHYEPMIDAKVMIESGRTLREGMFMEITDEDVVDNTTEYILIDTLSIYEDESAIPTYKVTLKERRKVTYKGTPSATATTSTKSVDDGSSAENGGNVDIDLSGYATTEYVDTKIAPFEDMFYFADENTIGTKYNFFSEQENSAGGVGEAIGTGGGGGDVDLTGYATEQWVQEQGYAKTTDIPSKVSELTNDKGYITSTDASATYATKSAYNSIETRVAEIEDDAAKMESSISGIEERVAEIEGSYATDEDLVALEDRVTAIEAGGGTGSGDVDLSAYATRTWVQSQGYALATAIPTKTSQLTNNSGFITSSSLTPYALKTDIPTKTSQITNDSEFITPTALAPYVKIADMPTKVSELDNDAGYLASLTADLVRDALGYTPFNASNFTATYIKSTLGIADWAMAATKPSYRYSEISGTPDLSLYALATDLNAYLSKATASSTYASKALLTSTLASYLLKSDIADWAKASSKPSYSYSEIKNTPDLSVYALASALADYALKTETYTKTDIADILKSYVLADDISNLVAWYNNVGSKFSKDTDGTIKMDGDFYTTGENSAGGAGDVVSGGTGGLDEAELEDYLTDNGYATQTWVTSQGYASSSALSAKQDKITDLATIRSNAAKGATALQSVPSEYITETELDQKGFATTEDLSGKVDKVAGKGLSTNDYTTADKNKLAGLENYDDSALVERVTTAEGKITTNTGNITKVLSRVATLETWFNAVGKYFTYDSASGAFKLTGNFYTTGENSAGGKGEQELNLDDLLARIVALENLTTTGKLAIDFQGLDDLVRISGSVTDYDMATIGLSSSAIEGLLDASYNKIVGTSVNRSVWNYTAYEVGNNIYIQFMRDDGIDALTSYSLARNSSTGYWTVQFNEI